MVLASVLAAAATYREGPVPAMTGGFGEQTCRSCHFDNPLNDEAGSVRLSGVPPRYEPGRSYRVAIDLDRAGLSRAGFELASRFASGPAEGQQAGRFEPIDALTKTIASEDGLVQYVQHNEAGSLMEDGSARWAVRWTAPDDARLPVIFHVAANASNDDASPLGDYIYTATATTDAAGDR